MEPAGLIATAKHPQSAARRPSAAGLQRTMIASSSPSPSGTPSPPPPYGPDRTARLRAPQRRRIISMLGIIAGILLVLWLLGFFAFHVAGSLIHILLVIAVIVFIVHLISGRRAVP